MNQFNIREIRIPTLLGLAILVVGLGIGVYLTNKQQIFQSQASVSTQPKNVHLANISANSVSIYWQSDKAVQGFVKSGTNSSLDTISLDDRDQTQPQNHFLHFVTISNLSPNSTYYYKISSGASLYPQDKPLQFTTTPISNITNLKPIIGTVVDTTSHPVTEAIITLHIDGAGDLATITKAQGNFILPLADIKAQSSNIEFIPPQNIFPVQLTAFNSSLRSQVDFNIGSEQTILPAIILGQNSNLIPQSATSSAKINFDLNHDGVVNTFDLEFILQNLNKKKPDLAADLNKDGVVDQKDVDLMNQAIANSLKK